jgi:WD40 repeat protein
MLLLMIYTEHANIITSIVFSSSDMNIVLSASRDQSLHIWHAEKHTQTPSESLRSPYLDDDKDTINHNGNQQKRNNKPRPNRAEREKKRATKVKCNHY